MEIYRASSVKKDSYNRLMFFFLVQNSAFGIQYFESRI